MVTNFATSTTQFWYSAGLVREQIININPNQKQTGKSDKVK